MKEKRKVHPRKFIVAHLNINSLKSKFDEIQDMFNEKIVDVLFISETKLDSSYRDGLFETPGYKFERRDRDVFGGGLAAFIKSDIPARRRRDLESKSLENITYEVILNKNKWSIMCVYRPPKMQDSEFGQEFKNTSDKCVSLFDRYMVIGDLNYDLLCETKGKPLLNIMELFNLSNLISKPTCFMKNSKPSLLDVILTNSKTQCIRTLNFATGISDCHNIISTVINNQIPINEKQRIQYRSYKSIDIDALNDEIKEIKLIGNITDENLDINSIYDQFESDLRNVLINMPQLKKDMLEIIRCHI